MTANDASSRWGEPEWITPVVEPDSPQAAAPATVSCRQLLKVYESSSGRVQAVRGVDLEIDAGTTAAVVGPSGSGKSSLLRMIAGLDTPTAGTVEVAGCDLFRLGARQRAERRGALLTHVHQRPSDNLLHHLTARQQLRRLARGTNPDADVDEVLDRLGLDHRSRHVPARLSGGEQQRLAFGRAAVAGHRLVIADEPTAQLDPGSARQVLETIDYLAERGTTVIVATHDDRVLPNMEQIVTLRDGAVASVTAAGAELVVIDRSGRLQLPPDVRAHFLDRRAVLEWEPDTDSLRIRKP